MSNSKNWFQILNLKEHTLYEVEVSWEPNNPMHQAFLFIGFSNGAYCQIYNNNYAQPLPIDGAYYIKIIKELCSIELGTLALPPSV